MDLAKIEYVLRRIGCTAFKTHNNKIQTNCPLSSYTHKGGRDKNPSFYAFNNHNNVPGFSCHACNHEGSLIWLLMELKKYTKDDYMDEYLFLKDNVSINTNTLRAKLEKVKPYYSSKGFEYFSTGSSVNILSLQDSSAHSILPESTLYRFFHKLPLSVFEYLKGPSRKLNPATISIWELGHQKDRNYISIPIRDINGSLVGITGRAVDQDKKPKYLHSEGFDRNKILFGEHRITKGGVCHLVEGHFDVIWLWQNGYSNPLGVMGTYLSPLNIKKLIDWFDEIVIVRDGDQAGLVAQTEWFNSLNNNVRVTIDKAIAGNDPNKLTPSQLMHLLGTPLLKKKLYSFFEHGTTNISGAQPTGSLKIEERVDFMDCYRCHRNFQYIKNMQSEVINVTYQNKLLFSASELCDSCVLDISRLVKQIKAEPELLDTNAYSFQDEYNELFK